ncbi:MAG: hypothetical protein LUE31_05400 [Lachnospiraceae bacterium]|nr:hypothetical protein [Lachnospiraceae bacterium]
MKKEILRMEHVSTNDTGMSNLHDFNLSLFQGETTAIIKLNDGGIDKLIEILCRNCPICAGKLYMQEKLVNHKGYSNYSRNNVNVIDRNSKLIPYLSVVDNVFFSPANPRELIIHSRQQKQKFRWLCEEYGLTEMLDANSREVNDFQRCIVEILHAVAGGSQLIVINQIEEIMEKKQFAFIKSLLDEIARHSFTILFICLPHQKMSQECDHCLFLRDGQDIRMVDRQNWYMKEQLLSSLAAPHTGKRVNRTSEVLLQAQNLQLYPLQDLSFSIGTGECLGIHGYEEKELNLLLQMFQRKLQPDSGNLLFENRDFFSHAPDENKILFVQRDIPNSMMMNELSYMDNLCIGLHQRTDSQFRSSRIFKAIKQHTRESVGDIVDAQSIELLTKEQKITLLYERLCLLHPKLVIFNRPFSENDFYVKQYIAQIINRLKQQNIAIIILTIESCDYLNIFDNVITLKSVT